MSKIFVNAQPNRMILEAEIFPYPYSVDMQVLRYATAAGCHLVCGTQPLLWSLRTNLKYGMWC